MNEEPNTSPKWAFKWLTSWDEVWNPEFVEQWSRWMDASPASHVFFHPAMVRAWVETYRPLRDIEPRFMVATVHRLQSTAHSPQSSVFLPLILDRGGWKDAWLKVLQPIGHNEYDYHDPIVAAGGGAPALRSPERASCLGTKHGSSACPAKSRARVAPRDEAWVVRHSSPVQNEAGDVKEICLSGYWQALFSEIQRRNGEFDLFCIPRLRKYCFRKESHNLVSECHVLISV